MKLLRKKYGIEIRLKDRRPRMIKSTYQKLHFDKPWHSCEMYNIIDSYHGNNVLGYTLGENAGGLKLCVLCACKLGFYSEEIPEWYPKDMNENTDLRNEIFEYAKNNSVFDSIVGIEKNKLTGVFIGKFYSQKNDNVFAFRSSLELVHLQAMENDKDIVKFSEGPSIKYFDYLNGSGLKERTYITDFKVWYKNKTIKIVEVKPYSFLLAGMDNRNGSSVIPKLEAVENYCKNNDYIFEYWI